jgi:hypothetical protein
MTKFEFQVVSLPSGVRSLQLKTGIDATVPVALFENSQAGRFAYGAFLAVVGPKQGYTVFDMDTNEYVVGTLDQLTTHSAALYNQAGHLLK